MSPCQPCDDLERLRSDLSSCSIEKDAQINSLAHQVQGMHGDLMRIDGDIKTMTVTIAKISTALDTIAANTTQITEVIQIYQNFKGFGVVTKQLALAVVGLASLAAAVVAISGFKITIG